MGTDKLAAEISRTLQGEEKVEVSAAQILVFLDSAKARRRRFVI